MIAYTALGVAIAEANWEVREEGGNNRGRRVSQYLASTDPPITVAAPWCAAFTQFCADVAADARGLTNPLNDVKLEALVQSYVNWAGDGGMLTDHPRPGDLACFRFAGSNRWNHIGFVLRAPDEIGLFWTVEGNTGDVNQRDGDGVYMKSRRVGGNYPVCFIRWA